MRLVLWCTGAYRGKIQKTVLLVRQDALGDFLISGAYYEEYGNYFHDRGYKVILVCKTTLEAIARRLPWIDGILSLNLHGSNLFQRIRLYRRIASLRPEYAVRLATMFGADIESVLACLYSGARYKAIFRSRPMDVPQTGALQEYACPYPMGPRQYLTRRLFTKREKLLLTDFWKYQGILSLFDLQATAAPCSSVFQQEASLATKVIGRPVFSRAKAPDYLPEEELRMPFTDYFCVVPGSSNPARRWPVEKFADVICRIKERYPSLTPVFCGLASEADISNAICRMLTPAITPLNLCGKTSIFQLLHLLKKARFVLSNDTGTAHLAALSRVPLVELHGGGHFGAYFPAPEYTNVAVVSVENKDCFYCNWLCHQLDQNRFPCVSRIPVSAVLHAIERILRIPEANAPGIVPLRD